LVPSTELPVSQIPHAFSESPALSPPFDRMC
jgi:hypothetical protein